MTPKVEREAGYQGWTNYETWAVALWIGNEQGTQEESHDMAQAQKKAAPDDDRVKAGIWTEDQAARYNMADWLKEWVEEEMIPDLGATLAADLLQAALSEVNWDELAENLLTETA